MTLCYIPWNLIAYDIVLYLMESYSIWHCVISHGTLYYMTLCYVSWNLIAYDIVLYLMEPYTIWHCVISHGTLYHMTLCFICSAHVKINWIRQGKDAFGQMASVIRFSAVHPHLSFSVKPCKEKMESALSSIIKSSCAKQNQRSSCKH